MDDVTDDAKGRDYRRIEVLTGPGRRRKWSDDDKARIVAETLASGAVVTEVARRWQICPQQVFGWRRERRLGTGAASATTPLDFVPIVPEAPPAAPEPSPSTSPTPSPAPSIEVELAGAVLRVPPGTDAALLTAVLRAVRASAT
jgi:transposase